jgi:nitrite reductase (NADH) large subunit
MNPYIIIGNGIAGNAAAENILKIEPQRKIVMFTRDDHYFYYTPALPEYLAGEKDIKNFTIHNSQWYEKNKIELHLKTTVTNIDPQKKIIKTDQNQTFKYDKLLLATGGYSFVPPIPGADSQSVFTLRTVADADRIIIRAKTSKEAVLIGGGLLGLEAGNGLRKMGLKVKVVEFFPRLLPRQMDTEGAAVLQKMLEDMGFKFHLGAVTKQITEARSRLSVHLDKGNKLSADMVLISAGVRPELTLAKSLGLEIDKGVQVDGHMQTGIKDIYAAGDLIEHQKHFYGIWPASMEQGRIAGANMAGKQEIYQGTVPVNSLKVTGIDLTSAGDIDPENRSESIVFQDQKNYIYRKFVIKNNNILGTILFGDTRGSQKILEAIKNKKDISAWKDKLGRPDFDFGLWK